VCTGDDDVYGDDEGGDDDVEGSSDGSGYVDRDMSPPRRMDSRYNRHRYRPHQLPPVPVDPPRFNPRASYVDPSLRLPSQPLSTRRRPVMYTAASVAGPVIYTTPGDVYFTRRRTRVGSEASQSSCVVSLMLLLAVVTASRLVVVCATLTAVS